MRSHARLRSSSPSTASSGASSDEDGDSSDDSSHSGSRRGSSTSDGGERSDDDSGSEDDAAARRLRKKTDKQRSRNTLLIVVLAVLLLVALGLAAWFYLRGGGSATLSEQASAGKGAGAAGGTGGSASAGGAGWGNVAGGTARGVGGTAGGGSKSAGTNTSSSAHGSVAGAASGGASSGKADASPAASPASTSLAASSPTVTSSPSKSCKKGVGYNDAKYTTNLDICWAYNWASSGGDGIRDGAMYVPMLWGPSHVDGWTDNAKTAISAGATHVLGFNEPDLPEQANLSPSSAAQLWLAQMEPLAGSAKLVSPGVTNGVKLDNGSALGVPWLQEFIKACEGCTIDAVALHWYDSAGNTAYFTSYLEDSHTKLGKPIWLTEFMGTGTPDEQKTFLEFAVPWLEKQDWIERYAAFGDFLDNPVADFIASADGTLNNLGQAYSDAK